MRKTFAFLLTIVIILPLSACASFITEPTPTPAPTPIPKLSLSIDSARGVLAVGDTHTIGVMSCGMAVYAGHNTAGQTKVTNWQNVRYAAANGATTAAITADGDILLAGEDAEAFAGILAVDDAVSLAVTGSRIVALTREGFVYEAGGEEPNVYDSSYMWNEITQIAAGDDFTLGLKADGTLAVDTADRALYVMARAQSRIRQIVAGDDFFALLQEDGEVITSVDVAPVDFEVERMFARGGTLLLMGEEEIECVTLSGETPQGMDEFLQSEYAYPQNILHIAFCSTHVAVALRDGSVVAFGNNDDLACSTEHFALRPVINGEYLTGIGEGTSCAAALTQIEALSLNSPSFVAEDGEKTLGASDIIATGTQLYDGESLVATALIYGDVNRDGAINENDAELVDAHISGESELEGIALLAADPVHSVGGRIIEAQAALIRSYTAGEANIKQYLYNPLQESLDAAIAKNEDVVGYIYLHDTVIDYPIMWGEDWYYNYYTIDKVRRNAGSIYSVNNFVSKNNAIAGHNMRRSGTMFHDLHKIQNNKEDLLVYANRVYTIQFIEGFSTWEVFALYETEEHEPVSTLNSNVNSKADSTPQEIEDWLNGVLERSEIDIGVDVSPDDQFATLYTCGDYYLSGSNPNQQARLYIFLRRLD